jgi:Xaa-Pro aminopeptidase
MRRCKDADELAIIRCAIAATEAAYGFAKEHLRAGVTEIELFAGMQAAAVAVVGEAIGEFGNDFQICSPGGPPRAREGQTGEIGVFDVSVVVRGYWSDLCRSFVVGGTPTEEQQAAYQRILYVMTEVERGCRPGARCRELFQMASELLEGYRGWKFGHHLGHGIGLNPHEAPHFNPNWDDELRVGDVFTLEPGLYGTELRAGLRIENNYYLSSNGLERISMFPMTL